MAGDGSPAPTPAVVNPEGSAPEGPSGTASSGPSAAGPSLTIFDLAEKHKFPKALVDSLLAALEADADTTLDDVLGVPESTMQEVMKSS